MRAHLPTLVVFSLLSLLVLAFAPAAGTWASAPGDTSAPATVVIAGIPDIVDGDSIKLDGISIRLHGIDAPEMSQSCKSATMAGGFKSPVAATWRCGLDARRALAQIIGNARVSCTPTTLDRYGRTVARCHTEFRQGGVDLGAEMVRQGMAWAFVKYSTDYVEIEKEARTAKRGVWQAETQSAWDFRASKQQQAEAEIGATAPAGCTIKGNVTWAGERIYHLPWSPWYAKVHMESNAAQRKGKRWFCNEAEAVAAGWRPAVK